MDKSEVLTLLCRMLGHTVVAAMLTLSLWVLGMVAGGFLVWQALYSSFKHCVEEHCESYDVVLLVTMPLLVLIGSSLLCGIFLWTTYKFTREDYRKIKSKTIELNAVAVMDEDPKIWLHCIEDSPMVTELASEHEKGKIMELVSRTWKYEDNLGRDCQNLKHSGITVKKVLQINNLKLWNKYKKRRNVSVRYEYPEELLSEPIMTSATAMMSQQELHNNDHSSEVYLLNPDGEETKCNLENNEVYLFHGTKISNIRSIVEHGFDFNRAKNGLYGKAIYLAESSQKADQYTDYPKNRRGTDLAMLVVRVTLRRVHYHYGNQPVDRPTMWSIGGTKKPIYDTVVTGSNKRFREFLVYNPKLCYTSFVILYDRNLD